MCHVIALSLFMLTGVWHCCDLKLSLLYHCYQHYSLLKKSFKSTICFRNVPCPCNHSRQCQIQFSSQAVLPCRLFAPPSLLHKFATEIQDYFPKCCKAVQELLGPSPFPKVDLVIFPSCSQDMAMSK